VGCINTSVQRLDHAVRPARSPDAVTVLLERPQRPYNVIAVIEANAKTVFDSFDDLRKAMVAEAAKLGGEAVILVSESTDSEFVFTGSGMIESDRRSLTGEVIVYERGD
jgi:lipopolysaccharide export system protein LptA